MFGIQRIKRMEEEERRVKEGAKGQRQNEGSCRSS